MGTALGRDGSPLGQAEIIKVRKSPAFDHTALVTMRVDKTLAMKARAYSRKTFSE